MWLQCGYDRLSLAFPCLHHLTGRVTQAQAGTKEPPKHTPQAWGVRITLEISAILTPPTRNTDAQQKDMTEMNFDPGVGVHLGERKTLSGGDLQDFNLTNRPE